MATQGEENKHRGWLQASGSGHVLTLFSLAIASIPKLLFFSILIVSCLLGMKESAILNSVGTGCPSAVNAVIKGCHSDFEMSLFLATVIKHCTLNTVIVILIHCN